MNMVPNIEYLHKQIEQEGFVSSLIKQYNSAHLLVRGDCEEIVKSMPSKSIDLIITDPPYNKGLKYGKKFNDSKSWAEYYKWLKERLRDIPRILSDHGSFYLISYPEINARLLPFLEEELGLKYRRWITWHYPTNIGHSKKNYTRSQRAILFFTKTLKYIFNREHLVQHYKNPTATVIRARIAEGSKGRTSYDLLRYLDLIELQDGLIDVLDIDLLKNNSKDRLRNINSKFYPMQQEELKKKDHPCQLPISLLELFIKVSSNKGGIVFDPFAGTFTTSVAAGKHERNSIGVEINGKYVSFGKRRIKML